jgi:copper chaperone
MRKTMGFAIAALAFVAFTVAPIGVMACGNDKKTSADKGAETQTISSKSGCAAGAKQANATQADAKLANCPAGSKEACAARLGLSVDDCQKVCAQGHYTLVSMNVKGMTCGSCEKTVSASLGEVPGVVRVGKVDYQTGKAYVLIDPTKVKDELLVKAVSSKGYEAEVIPAVAVEPAKAEGNASKMDAAHDGCSAAQKAACAATGKTCGSKKATEKKEEKKTDGSM